jgi:hypothetical protein
MASNKRRGMEAVASKAARRTPIFRRRASDIPPEPPASHLSPPPPPVTAEEGPVGLLCPECGMELADTEQNRAYLAEKDAGMDAPTEGYIDE